MLITCYDDLSGRKPRAFACIFRKSQNHTQDLSSGHTSPLNLGPFVSAVRPRWFRRRHSIKLAICHRAGALQ